VTVTTQPHSVATRVAAAVMAAGYGLAPAAWAQAPKSGENVYKEVCAVCHATGVAGAPKFGDQAAWGPRLAEGQPALTGQAWVGVREMPPRGGDNDLSLDEFARAAAFMVRAAGGNWQDPDAKILARIQVEAAKRDEATATKQ
jgi:cytochrome c5